MAGIEGAMASGARIWLADKNGDGSLAVFALSELLRDPGFGPMAGPRLRVPQVGLLSTVPEDQQLRALDLERHVREVETGYPTPSGKGLVKPQYDPAVTTLAQREQAKADELAAQGWPRVSRATVRRWRARYHADGVWGLVVRRRGSTRLERADPGWSTRCVRCCLRRLCVRAREGGRSGCGGRRSGGWMHGMVSSRSRCRPCPRSNSSTLWRSPSGCRGRWRSGVPAPRAAPPFKPTLALRPGEIVMMDSSPLDAMVVLDDGVVGRLELTTAVDVAVRGLWGVLRPAGTKLTDVAVLLAQMMTPVVMRPGWDAALSMAASVVPHERLTAVDERLKDAAARPVIVPETVVVDQGKVFISPATRAACESLGISLQPVPPANGPAKGHVERSFGSIGTEFCQWLPGFTGSRVSERGSRVEQERLWTVSELQVLWEEFLVHWHHHPREGLRHPLMPKKALTPNQMWAALLPVAGYVPVPLSADDFVELLPVRWQPITDAGVRFDYRTYDDPCLNGHRGQDSGVASEKGLWEVHYNPYDPVRIWVRLPEGFREVAWIHATSVGRPFTHHVWEHICKVVERTGSREEHEAALVLALDGFLKRAARKEKLSTAERRVVAKSRASGAVPVPAGELNVLDVPAPSFGLAGVYAVPDLDDDTVPDTYDGGDEGEDIFGPRDDELEAGRSAGGCHILGDTEAEEGPWLP
ncbi:transposase [Streptomyces aureocirculatus]|uniref:transposase n=1 Tax=Streptomyces aureocirculatus TaxID=67275 RepID=UPI000B19ED2D|nr:transposase [Streptomyces aureocirculatus]